METIATNRDFYTAVSSLIDRERQSSCTLEVYLSSLWSIVRESSASEEFSPDAFFGFLSTAFEAGSPDYNEKWAANFNDDKSSLTGFVNWETTILRQVVDLHEMSSAGIFDNELRYFGVCSPRGSNWYNFDPCGYLECATAGWCGGWQPGDSTGRELVPGPVAVLGDDGHIESRNPEELENPTVKMPPVTWDSFCDFLWCGQNYE